MENYSN